MSVLGRLAIFVILWKDRDFDDFFSLSLFKYKRATFMGVVNASGGGMLGVIKLDSLVVDGNFTVRTILSHNFYFGLSGRSNSLDWLGVLESNRSWLVIIYNCYNSFSISTFEQRSVLDRAFDWFVKLDPEIFIRLPVVIIINRNSNKFQSVLFLSCEFKNFINFFVVIASLSLLVDGTNSDAALLIELVLHIDSDGATCFGDRVVQASESELGVRVLSVLCRSQLVLEHSVFGNLHFLATQSHLPSVLHSCEHGSAFDCLLEILQFDFINFISVHCLFQEIFHFLNFNLMLISLILIWVFLLLN